MRKRFIVLIWLLCAVTLPGLTIDLSGNPQEGVELFCSGNVQFQTDQKKGHHLTMEPGSRLQLQGEVFKDSAGFDFAIQPKGSFTIRGRLGGKAFMMRYADDWLLCRAENSPSTALVPAYAWKNHAVRYMMVRSNQEGNFLFYVDGVPALEQNKITLAPETSEYPFDLEVFGILQLKYLATAMTTLTEPLAKDLYHAMVTRKPKQSLPTLVIPEFRPPEGDAAFDENNWHNAARITDFVLLGTGKRCERQTVVMLGADSEGIYVFFKSPVIDKLTGSPMAHDEGFGGDSVEFFFMPTYTETFDYYQFIGNFLGTTYDSRGQDLLWNGTWTHQAKYDQQQWISVFRIKDFSTFAAPKPQPGSKWRFNVCRDWQTPKGWLWSQFSNTPGFYSNYNSFAHAVYGGTRLPYFRLASLAKRKDRQISAAFEAVNPADQPIELRAVYSFYAPGSFNISERSETTILLAGQTRQEVWLTVAAEESSGGMVELSISNADTGEILCKQAVIL